MTVRFNGGADSPDYVSIAHQRRYARPRPLALYVFDRGHRRVKRMLHATASGGVGAVGMGRYHGPEGFTTISQFRSAFRQSRLGIVAWIWPPYK